MEPPLKLNQQDEMVAKCSIAPFNAENSCRNRQDPEPDRGESPAQEAIHLVTPTTSSSDHQLVEYALNVPVKRSAELHIDVLEGNRQCTSSMNSSEAIERGLDRAVVPDPIQVGIDLRHDASPRQRALRVTIRNE